MLEKIGLIPIENYIEYMNWKNYNKELAIQYVIDNYELDISEYDFELEQTDDVYYSFNKINQPKKEDDGTREYFSSCGRKRYLDYYKFSYPEHSYDFCAPFLKGRLVHHIYPLVFSNDNSLQNLVLLNKFNHNLLHMNPLENIKKYNYQALDYLYYLETHETWHLYEKYLISNYENDINFASQMFLKAIENEMVLFYKQLQREVA